MAVIERENMTPFQQLLVDYTLELQNKKGRLIGDTEMARHFKVNYGSYNAWVNGTREPDMSNAIKIAEKIGPQVYDVLGLPRVVSSRNPQLRFIVEYWDRLDSDIQKIIYDHVREEAEKADVPREKLSST
jgi:hypothetical protein